MENQTWIVVADASQAKIFHTNKTKLISNNATGKDIHLVSTHEHDASRQKDLDLVTDKPGNFGVGSFVEGTEPKRHEAEKFALELSKILSQARNGHHFKEVILIAPPEFMGMLKKALPEEIEKIVNLTIEKNYTKIKDNELVSHLVAHL